MGGNLWLFGGYGFIGFMNDLWKFNTRSNEWTWVSGDNVSNQVGIYGSKGGPSPGNKLGARTAAAAWTDANGQFWLFGGNNNNAHFNDLWRYNPITNEWIWISGDNIPDQSANYGSKGVPSPTNKPGSRGGVIYWSDQHQDLWRYGGYTYIGGVYNAYSDLWKYDLRSSLWTWVSGDNTHNQPAVFGNSVPTRRSPARLWQRAGTVQEKRCWSPSS